MKNVNLKVPRVIDGVVRHPAEGTIPVSDEVADQLIEEDAAELVDDGEELPEEPEDDDGLEGQTMPDLGILVTKEGVPLNGVTKKADIIAAIRAHRASKEA